MWISKEEHSKLIWDLAELKDKIKELEAPPLPMCDFGIHFIDGSLIVITADSYHMDERTYKDYVFRIKDKNVAKVKVEGIKYIIITDKKE